MTSVTSRKLHLNAAFREAVIVFELSDDGPVGQNGLITLDNSNSKLLLKIKYKWTEVKENIKNSYFSYLPKHFPF